MKAVKIKDYLAQCKGGDRPWEAWGNSPTAEIVAQRFMHVDGTRGDKWVVAHRRTGRTFMQWSYRFTLRADALAAAQKIEGLYDWSIVNRSSGFGELPKMKNRKAVQKRVLALLEEVTA